ncbi:SH3 domain-containing protein [Heyndrickxia sp. NPDC080065]|uniref:SH3 domain-containing protein n=1 Tax=Heyndrickxia sp. NPDC080065 TaxID=3390568 RepID=UPI003CFD2AF4
MKKSIILKMLLCFILLIPIMTLSNSLLITKAATPQIGKVDLENGTLNVRNGPGINNKKIGFLRNGAKVNVYNQTKSGWSEIRYNKKKAYISTQYLRFDLKMSLAQAKSITDKVISMQRKTWERNYTKKQIYSIITPGYTTAYIDKYFKQQMRTAGKNKNGTQLYHVIETEIWGYAIDTFDWKAEYQPKKPAISYNKKNEKEYVVVSQFLLNEESGDHTSRLYLSRSNPKKNWKVYKYTRKYGK